MGKKGVLFCPSGSKMGMILPKEAEMPQKIRRENRCSGVFRGPFSLIQSIMERIMDFQLFCKFFFMKNKKWTKILSKKKLPDTFLVLINTRFLDDTKNYRTL
jgi:uroporphyrinogen-III decarboxylase